MKIAGDFHTHTKASDGKGRVRDNVKSAKDMGLDYVSMSDHGIKSLSYNQTPNKLLKQANEIEDCAKEFGIKVFKSIESNLMGFDGKIDIEEKDYKNLDVLNCGYHRFIKPRFNGEYFDFAFLNGFAPRKIKQKFVEVNTEAYIKAIEKYPIDTLCHLGHRMVSNIVRVAEACKANDVYVELNEKHIEVLEPCLEKVIKTNVNFILGSDAHDPKLVGKFPRVEKIIEKYRIPQERIVGIGKEPVFKNK